MSIVDAQFTEQAAPASAHPAPVAQRMNIAAFKDNADDFSRIKAALLQPIGRYTNNISGKDCVNTDGWQRIAAALQVSTAIVSFAAPGCPGARREVLEDAKGKRIVSYSITVRASFGDRYADATGRCGSDESRHAQSEHKMEAVAHSRAKNRAICALVGGSPSDIAEEQEERIDTARRTSSRETPSAKVPVPELQRIHAEAGLPEGKLRAWIEKAIPDFDGKALTPAQSVRARDLLRELIDLNGGAHE